MIEFKSPCGHTVRARDEDAGRDVKCNYCGKEVRVPSDRADDLDFLLTEVGGSEVEPPARAKARRGGPFSGRRTRGESGPMDTVLKLTYAAVAVTVIVVVSRSFIIPQIQDMLSPPPPPPQQVAEQPAPKPQRGNMGLGLEGAGGLYVSAVPATAEIWVADGKGKSPGARIDGAGERKKLASGETLCGAEGPQLVEVALPWNDKSLRNYPDYLEFRRKLEHSEAGEPRNALMKSYFLPDNASAVFVAVSGEQTYLVRQYLVTPRKDEWASVQALFVPAQVSLQEVVTRYLPSEEKYRFDDEHVRGELEYYNVPVVDRTFVMDALKRVGVIPYETDDGSGEKKIRLFKIDVGTGQFTAPPAVSKDVKSAPQADAKQGK